MFAVSPDSPGRSSVNGFVQAASSCAERMTSEAGTEPDKTRFLGFTRHANRSELHRPRMHRAAQDRHVLRPTTVDALSTAGSARPDGPRGVVIIARCSGAVPEWVFQRSRTGYRAAISSVRRSSSPAARRFPSARVLMCRFRAKATTGVFR